VHGPLKYGGANLPSLFSCQGLGQLKFLLGHLHAQDKTSQLILTCLNVSWKQHSFLTWPPWLTSVWHFMPRINLTIVMTQAWLLPATHESDLNLMEWALSQHWPRKKPLSFNRCRVYLKVLNLSDIASADGSQIIAPILHGQHLTDRHSLLVWPEQANPTKSDWSNWESALSSLCHGLHFLHPVTMCQETTNMEWFWFMDDQRILFHKTADQWLSYTPSVPSRSAR